MTRSRPAWSRESRVLRLPQRLSSDGQPPGWAFDGSTGEGTRVAVIDSGVEADHPLLAGCVDEAGGVEFALDPSSGDLLRRDGPHGDVYGHGTACAGIIHALAPGATITSVRVLDEGLRGKAAAFHAGLDWAIDNEFDVINLSLGAARREWALAFHESCDRGYFANSFIVTAANNAPRESFPSLFASVASVAANNSSDPLRYHVNPDPPTEFLARGIDVEVPWLGASTIVTTGNSFAAPHIAGFAALIRSKHPQLRPFQVKAALWGAAANVREAVASDRAGRRSTIGPGLRRPRGPARRDPAPSGQRRTADREPPTGTEPWLMNGRSRVAALLPDCEVGEQRPSGPWGAVRTARRRGVEVVLHEVDLDLARDERTRDRLLSSLRIVATLRHPHLLPVLELAESEDLAVLVTPSTSVSLADVMAGGVSEPDAIAATVGLLRGLGAAHARGVFHGDLRPASIPIGTDGRALVSDVGVAAALSSDVRTTAVPNDPRSWSHLAPEQFDGDAIGAFTDVHGAGLVLFELLTTTLPYPPVSNLGALVRQRATQGPRTLPDLRPDLDDGIATVVEKAVAVEPAARHQSVASFEAALAAAADRAHGDRWRTGRFRVVGAAGPVSARRRTPGSGGRPS